MAFLEMVAVLEEEVLEETVRGGKNGKEGMQRHQPGPIRVS